MTRLIDLTGQVFGRLTVLYQSDIAGKKIKWHCLCACGNTSDVDGYKLRIGETQSCGCLSRELISKRQLINLAGKRFARLVVLKRVGNGSLGEPQWLCQCDCGNTTVVRGVQLRKAHTRSCGCLALEVLQERSTTHGKSHTPTYAIHQAIKARCSDPKNKYWANYGGRGIKVCDRWLESFENFLEDMGEKPSGYSIERIDVNGNYEPENCKWIPFNQQARNTTKTIKLTYAGTTKPLVEWAEESGIKPGTLYWRIKKGWEIERALTTNTERKKHGTNRGIS